MPSASAESENEPEFTETAQCTTDTASSNGSDKSETLSPPEKREKQRHLSLEIKELILNVYKVEQEENCGDSKTYIKEGVAIKVGIGLSKVYDIMRKYEKQHKLQRPATNQNRKNIIDSLCETAKHAIRRIILKEHAALLNISGIGFYDDSYISSHDNEGNLQLHGKFEGNKKDIEQLLSRMEGSLESMFLYQYKHVVLTQNWTWLNTRDSQEFRVLNVYETLDKLSNYFNV